jgi:hypothetical protein
MELTLQRGELNPENFFKKAEVFAATKGFKKVLLEEGVLPSWAEKEDLTKEEMEMVKQSIFLLCHAEVTLLQSLNHMKQHTKCFKLSRIGTTQRRQKIW